ncbi:hypothetical protein Cni_G22791 [Canna indica]|uniref:ARM repeat superfamily protein n=1 Tax=Canna indica TaxID=4628 RepID=A0AAQ3QLX2_9LILI|nr:hypothetical protein Cni_G22791 [Canna indica]
MVVVHKAEGLDPSEVVQSAGGAETDEAGLIWRSRSESKLNVGDEVRRCRRLIGSLSDVAAGAQCFQGWWSAVAAAVSRLLVALDDLPSLSSNPLTSDIAVASVALLLLAVDADLLLRSSPLVDPPSSPPEAAGGSNRKEPVQSEARSLVTRLQIGSSSSRIVVLGSLLDLLSEDDKNVVVAAGQGVVQALVRLLNSIVGATSCHEAREKAATAIATISTVQSCRHLLAMEGPPLLHHLA